MIIKNDKVELAKNNFLHDIDQIHDINGFKFVVIKYIANGAFGVLLKIRDLTKDRIYALKCVYQDPKYYHRELEILQIINHPNVLSVLRHFYFNIDSFQYLCIITEYYENTFYELIYMNFNLNVCIKNCFIDSKKQLRYLKRGSFRDFEDNKELRFKDMSYDDQTFRRFFKQALEALMYLHERNICHRDLKPTNILISNDNLILCDFGSAKIIVKDQINITYICSRYYRAPENLLGKRNYDCKIDIWAIALVFLELIIGRPVFFGNSNADQLARIFRYINVSKEDCLELEIPFEEKTGNIIDYLTYIGIEEKLAEVFEKSIVFNPKKRYTAEQLLDLDYFKL